MAHSAMPLSIRVSNAIGDVQALLLRSDHAKSLLVLAHGAGAGMRHPFMDRMARKLAGCRVATLRYEFPYMQQRTKRPDAPGVLMETVRAAVTAASHAAPDLPLLAGGKSLGGRMTSLVYAQERSTAESDLPVVRGLVFFGFPLHPAGRPGTQRAEHLAGVQVPMLFLQGTRDALADLPLMRSRCMELAPRASLHVVEGADHSFHVLKRSGRTDEDILDELAHTVEGWMESLV
jgi:predicted alpha/beta-hydrolase family hydrolase